MGVGTRIILKVILKVWRGFNWLRIKFSFWIFPNCNKPFTCTKEVEVY
jgi:hypothetical protein